jgi:hypothetical protein
MGNQIRKRGRSMRRTEPVVGSARLHLHAALLRTRAVCGVAVGANFAGPKRQYVYRKDRTIFRVPFEDRRPAKVFA